MQLARHLIPISVGLGEMIAGLEKKHGNIRPLRDQQIDDGHAFGLKAARDAGGLGVLCQHVANQGGCFVDLLIQIHRQIPSPPVRASSGSRTPVSSRRAITRLDGSNVVVRHIQAGSPSEISSTSKPAFSSASMVSSAAWSTTVTAQPRSKSFRSSVQSQLGSGADCESLRRGAGSGDALGRRHAMRRQRDGLALQSAALACDRSQNHSGRNSGVASPGRSKRNCRWRDSACRDRNRSAGWSRSAARRFRSAPASRPAAARAS